jgi:quinol monooxygenase YgiN
MIELHLVLKAPANRIRPLTDALQVLADSARSKPGCLAVELYKSLTEPRRLYYDEIWESEADLRRMLASHHFCQLATLMEQASEAPTCEFRFIRKTYGFDFAEKVRGLSSVPP